MTNKDYTTSFNIDRTPAEVFAAIANPRGWWSEDVDGRTDRLGEVFYYHYQDIHRGTFKVSAFEPSRKIAWHVLQNTFNFTRNPAEWTGTDIVFELSPSAGGTDVKFTHVGLNPAEECYEACRDSWRFYVNTSLVRFIFTGTGQPNKGEDNANPTVVPPPAAENFTTRFEVDATPEAVFAAINNVGGWWDGEVTGKTHDLGDEFDYRYADMHYSRQKLVELVPNRRVAWSVLEAELSFLADKTEWTGTTIVFDIVPNGKTTELVFTHVGLKPAIECYDACSSAWGGLIGTSLRSLIETGKGVRTISG